MAGDAARTTSRARPRIIGIIRKASSRATVSRYIGTRCLGLVWVSEVAVFRVASLVTESV